MADDDGRGTGTVPASVVLAMGMPTTKEDELLCEGYLKKIRGFAQNRRRWFRVTANHIAFFSADGGSLISYIHRDHVSDVRDISKYRFLISTHKPFGASGASSMILEASTPEAKNRWLLCLQKTTDSSRGTQEDTGHLYTEGYMCKLQGFGSRDRTRWFVLTDRYFSYYTTEAGDLMGRCPIEQIQSVKPIQDHTFVLESTAPFTRTGHKVVTCRCENARVRDKWLASLTALLGSDKAQTSEFSPLPQTERGANDHFGVMSSRRSVASPYDNDDELTDNDSATRSAAADDGACSEGNRFILNDHL